MGPDLMQRFQKHAERFDTQRSCSTTSARSSSGSAPSCVLRGDAATYTCDAPDHRHRRLGQVPRPAVGNGFHGPRRQRLRDLRRLLLPRPGGVRRGRRQHRGRRSALPLEHREARHRDPSARQVPRRGDPGRQAVAKVASGKMELHLCQTLDEVLGDATRRDRRADPQHRGRRRRRTWPSPAASSPSATSPTPTSSRASSR